VTEPTDVRERLLHCMMQALSKNETDRAYKLIEGYEKLVRAQAVDHTIKEDRDYAARQKESRQAGPERSQAGAVQKQNVR
jgi:hypothetical protein